MINNHGATGGDRVLNGGATSLADKQMALTKQARKLIGPTQDVDLATALRTDLVIVGDGFDCASKLIIIPDSHGEMEVEIEKFFD